MYKIIIFISRLKKIGIDIEVSTNYPWIYLDKVNGNRVKEKYLSKYGFTIAFLPVKLSQELKFNDISEIFRVIRIYALMKHL